MVFFELGLVGRLENIGSDRRLIEQCALRLDIRSFLGYEVDEDLPWHSTISRTRQLYPAANCTPPPCSSSSLTRCLARV